jgi:hypothetical protein
VDDDDELEVEQPRLMTEIPSPLPFDNSYVIEQVRTMKRRKSKCKKGTYMDIMKDYERVSQYVEAFFGT